MQRGQLAIQPPSWTQLPGSLGWLPAGRQVTSDYFRPLTMGKIAEKYDKNVYGYVSDLFGPTWLVQTITCDEHITSTIKLSQLVSHFEIY
jgi:hypothetical protein